MARYHWKQGSQTFLPSSQPHALVLGQSLGEAAHMKPGGNNSLCWWHYWWFSAAFANSTAQWTSLAAGRWRWGKPFQRLLCCPCKVLLAVGCHLEQTGGKTWAAVTTLDSPLPLAQTSRLPQSCSGRLHCTNYHFVPIPFSFYSNTLSERGTLHSQRKRLNCLQSYNESDTSSGVWISPIVNLLLTFFFPLLCYIQHSSNQV